MICILSQSFYESSTEAVIEWLRAWNIPFVRVNRDDMERLGVIRFSTMSSAITARLVIDDEVVDLNAIKAVWYRRWQSKRGANSASESVEVGKILARDQDSTYANTLLSYLHVTAEIRTCSEFLFSRLSTAAWLGAPQTSSPNKLQMLELAHKSGLDIPPTLVTSDPTELLRFLNDEGQVVTKPLSDMLWCWVDDSLFATYTCAINEQFVTDGIWQGGFPSMFQKMLIKRYDIRTFYLDGVCYSMAIFSQNSAATQVDFRHYGGSTRWVPFLLPDTVQRSLQTLMAALSLDTGSIDLVRTKDGRYVFLEVNPVGQFGMVSGPCNYALDRKIAQSLVQRNACTVSA